MTASRETESEELRAYTQFKLGIATQLRGLREILHRRGNSARLRRCEELMTKLAEDRFTLAVLGQFKRGKSSLMNAIIGRELLPTGVLPLTSAITVLKFGSKEQLVIDRGNFSLPQIVSVTELADYVTERGNPGNRKKVRTATLELPLPFLRRGLEFVDTPGVGSAIEANTATTYSFLPECDAALFVTSVDTPLTSNELEFLRAIREHARKIFFVVNKMDLLKDEAERNEVIDFVTRALREQVGRKVRVFAVSALLGLAAEVASNSNDYDRSGLKKLQETLATFLSREKAPVFLAAIIERALRLVDEEIGEVALFKKARELSENELRQRMEIVRARMGEHAAARRELFDELRRYLIEQTRASLAPELRAFLKAQRKRISSLIDRVLSHAGWRFSIIVAEHCGQALARELGNAIERWQSKHIASLDFEADRFARECWLRIQSNLRGLFADATKDFDLPNQATIDDLPAWHLSLETGSRFNPDLPEQIDLPAWLMFAPSVLVRRALKHRIELACKKLSEFVEADALESVALTIGNRMDQLAREVEEIAGEIQSRVTSAITGEQPKRRGASQGMRPPEEMDWGDSALTGLRAQLEALADKVSFTGSDEKAIATRPIGMGHSATVRQPIRRVVEKNFAKRVKSRGCPICDELDAVAFDFFAQEQYALAVDEKAQTEFAMQHGFCPMHTWQLHAISSTAGESAGLGKLIDEISKHLANGKAAASSQSLAPGTNDCRVCHLLHDAESESIRRFGEFLNVPDNREIYAGSQGLCLRHLEMSILASPSHAPFLRSEAAHHFQQIAEDMQNYALKRDATRNTLTNADERDALLRAVIHVAGAKNLYVPRAEDVEI